MGGGQHHLNVWSHRGRVVIFAEEVPIDDVGLPGAKRHAKEDNGDQKQENRAKWVAREARLLV